MNKNKILSGGGKNLIGGGKWGRRRREVGEKGGGSGGKGGGNWEWGTPCPPPHISFRTLIAHLSTKLALVQQLFSLSIK